MADRVKAWLVPAIFITLSSGGIISPQPAFASDEATVAMAYFNKGDFKEAQRCFENLTLLEPNNSRAAYYLALTHLRQKQTEVAERQFRMIVDKFPKTYEAEISTANLRSLEAGKKATEKTTSTTSTQTKPAVEQSQTGPASETGNSHAQRDFEDAQKQAAEIKRGAATRAQFYLDQASQKAAELKQVLVGRQFAGRAYSDERIEAETADLKKQAAIIIESGNNEANDLLNRAKLRKDSETQQTH